MRKDIIDNRDLILELIKDEQPKTEICRRLKCRPDTLNTYLEKMGIVYKGNQSMRGKKKDQNRKSAMYYIENDLPIISNRLKYKLIEDGIKEYRCESCYGTEWLGKPIPLELHHIDGDKYNNNLENLMILCPNCHSFTDNFASKNLKSYREKMRTQPIIEEKKVRQTFRCSCGVEIKRRSKKCTKCSQKSMRIVDRPEFEILLREVSEFGYSAIGRKYGVSDNAIRKWIKSGY
jgi:Zn finger protein HypA/HybF involved in hydrogenase expression